MKHKWLTAVLGGIFLCLLSGYYVVRAGSGEISLDEKSSYAVAQVLDGDTFIVNAGARRVTIRLLGIDTPESVDPRKPVECYGPESAAETRRLLAGRRVMLKYNPDREKSDKYGRHLVYAYRDDGLFLNEHLIRNGFAREYTYGRPYSMQKEFRSSESAARSRNVGLWGKCKFHE